MTKEQIINNIWDSYIDIQDSCGMVTKEQAMNESVTIIRNLLIAYELKTWINPTQEHIEIAEKIVDSYLNNQ